MLIPACFRPQKALRSHEQCAKPRGDGIMVLVLHLCERPDHEVHRLHHNVVALAAQRVSASAHNRKRVGGTRLLQ